MPTVNLNAPSAGLPLAVQQAQAAQAQAMAQALMKQSIEPGAPVIHTGGGNPFARDVPNYGDAIAKVAQAYFGGKQSADAAARQGEIADQYQKTLSNDTSNVVDRIFPQEQPGIGPPSPDGTPAPAFTNTRDIPGAMKAGMGSQIPEVRTLTEALLKKQVEGIPTDEAILKDSDKYDPAGVAEFRRTGNAAALIGRGKSNFVEGVHVGTKDANVVGAPAAVVHYKPPTIDPNTGLPGQEQAETGKVTAMSGGNLTQASTLANEVGKAEVAQLTKGREEFISAGNAAKNIVNMQGLIKGMPDSAFGAGADIKQGVNKVLEAIGAKPAPLTAKMDELRSMAGNNMIERIRALAPVTEEDVKLMKGIVGSETNTKVALQKILEIASDSAVRARSRHTEFVKSFAKHPGVQADAGFEERWAPSAVITPSASFTGDQPPTGDTGRPPPLDWNNYPPR